MVVIILAVYKTCNKNREAEIRREINGTYAHVIEGCPGDLHPSPYINSSHLFPPPPPPYGSLMANSSSQTGGTSTTSLLLSNAASSPGTTTTSTAPAMMGGSVGCALPNEVVVTGAGVQVASVGAEFKPTSDVASAVPPVATTTTTTTTSATSGWGNFLAGTAAVSGVAGYLLSRRK